MANLDYSKVPATITITNPQTALTADEIALVAKNPNNTIVGGNRVIGVPLYRAANVLYPLAPQDSLVLYSADSTEIAYYVLVGEKAGLTVTVAEVEVPSV